MHPPFAVSLGSYSCCFIVDVLDGAMVVLALYSFNFAHPGMLLNMNTSHSPEVQDKNTELKSIEDGERL